MRNSGFTIIELMIASAIVAIVMVFTMQTFTVNNRTYIKIDSVVDAQQSVRAVASVLERDLRHAGMMVPEGAAALRSRQRRCSRSRLHKRLHRRQSR